MLPLSSLHSAESLSFAACHMPRPTCGCLTVDLCLDVLSADEMVK